MASPSWIEKLKLHWKLGSAFQVLIILLVFACTGFTIFFIKKPVLRFVAGAHGDGLMASALYYLLILPLYNGILLAYGFLFGQFNFFWEFEKRFFNRIFGKNKKDTKK